MGLKYSFVDGARSVIHRPLDRMAFLQVKVFVDVVMVMVTPVGFSLIFSTLVFYSTVRLELHFSIKYFLISWIKSSAAKIPAFISMMGLNFVLINGMAVNRLQTSSGDKVIKLSVPSATFLNSSYEAYWLSK